jgi:hypothetical protein
MLSEIANVLAFIRAKGEGRRAKVLDRRIESK